MHNDDIPLVSIAIISYNSEKFIGAAIESALNQDYPNIEIVISDDASTDTTRRIILDYSNKYPDQIKYLLSSENKGITSNWFNCIQSCSGKYIASLGADDELLPNKISQQVTVMERDTNIVICYTNAYVYNIKSDKVMYHLADKVPPKSGNLKISLSDCLYYSPTIMHRNAATPKENIFTTIRHGADLAFYKQLMILSAPHGKIEYLPVLSYKYNKHETNVTATQTSYRREHIEAIKILQKKYPKYAKYLAPSISDFCFIGMIKSLLGFNYNDFKYFFSHGIRSSNGNLFKLCRPIYWICRFLLIRIKSILFNHFLK